MQRFFGLIAFFFLFANGILAQASAYVHEKLRDSLVVLFNKQQLGEIYELTSGDFQKQVSEAALTDLFQNGLYAVYGPIQKCYLFKETDHYQAVILEFKTQKVQLNLSVNEDKKIKYLELVPYEEVSLARRSQYFSDNKKQTSLDSLVDEAVAGYMQSPKNCGLSIALIWKGQAYYYNYGETVRDGKQPCSATTPYEIGSLSKTFCATLLAMAVAEGKVKLDDDVRKYLPGKYPGLSLNGESVQLQHLANHSSGLPRIPDNLKDQPAFDSLNPYKNYTKEMLLKYLKTVSLESTPGKECSYSNLGMTLLGFVLEEVYGKSFEVLVKEQICKPQGMDNTFVSGSDKSLLSTGYNVSGQVTPHWDLGIFAPAGGICSTTGDMLKYLNYQLNAQDPVIQLSHRISFSDRKKLGLAWFISPSKSGFPLIWHNGGTFGYRSFCGLIQEKELAVVVLSNSAMDVDYLGIAILNYLQQ